MVGGEVGNGGIEQRTVKTRGEALHLPGADGGRTGFGKVSTRQVEGDIWLVAPISSTFEVKSAVTGQQRSTDYAGGLTAPEQAFFQVTIDRDEFKQAGVRLKLRPIQARRELDDEARVRPTVNDGKRRFGVLDVVDAAASRITAGGIEENGPGGGQASANVGDLEASRQSEHSGVQAGNGNTKGVDVQTEDGGSGGREGQCISADSATGINH
jgi:hypothetical protein